MRIVNGGNYSHPRVEHIDCAPADDHSYKPFFVKHGAPYAATELDPMAPPGLMLQDWIFPGYPLVIEEDTTFEGANFAQAVPHTPIFEIRPVPGTLVNARLVLRDCNLINVTTPDGAEIDGGNLAQVVRTPTGNEDRPEVNLLHECEKCASAVVTLRKMIKSKAQLGFTGVRWEHHKLKPLFRERRNRPELAAADLATIRNENAACLARWAPGKTPEEVAAVPVVVDVPMETVETAPAEQGWWAKVKAFFGVQ